MVNWDAAVKHARECHTKHAWEAFFEEHGEAVQSTGQSKPLQEIFRLLKADQQSLQYDPRIWGRLIQGCLSSWNLELGREIAEHVKRVASAAVSIPAAQVYLDSGQPMLAREVASRALRLSGLTPKDKLSLELAVATSFAEEGKRQKTVRLLNQIRSSVNSPTLAAKERADFLVSLGRMQFPLGRYVQAAEVFYDASKLFREIKDWEGAAKAIFNAAACHLNGGTKRSDEAFAMIEECRRLSEAENLPGPLSHCEAAYGLDAYQHGDFAGAREHLRRALEYLPISDKSYRRLHILSMLAFNYLAMGRYHLARKFGRQTLDLWALEESQRFKTRYTTLQAELLWEDGLIEESQALLGKDMTPFETDGVHTLEELATLTRHNLQSALLDGKHIPTKVVIDESLKKNLFTWLDWVNSLGQLLLNQRNIPAATRHFQECLTRARQSGDRYHEALGLLGSIQAELTQRKASTIDPLVREFEIVVSRVGETPLKSQLAFVHAAKAYQQGDFGGTERILRLALKSTRLSFPDRLVLSGWLATIDGRSPRLTSEWQAQFMARYTRLYFAPTLEALDERTFRVSGHYVVSLERHSSLAELLHYLMMKSNFSATTAEIQTHVWKQSLATQGWQQKIRNAIMRLRDFFPQTIAPIIVHADMIGLFKDAIEIKPTRRLGQRPEEEILVLLADAPMSSTQIAERLSLSQATIKRILKRLSDDREIHATKSGRNVVYSTGPVTDSESASILNT